MLIALNNLFTHYKGRLTSFSAFLLSLSLYRHSFLSLVPAPIGRRWERLGAEVARYQAWGHTQGQLGAGGRRGGRLERPRSSEWSAAAATRRQRPQSSGVSCSGRWGGGGGGVRDLQGACAVRHKNSSCQAEFTSWKPVVRSNNIKRKSRKISATQQGWIDVSQDQKQCWFLNKLSTGSYYPTS